MRSVGWLEFLDGTLDGWEDVGMSVAAEEESLPVDGNAGMVFVDDGLLLGYFLCHMAF